MNPFFTSYLYTAFILFPLFNFLNQLQRGVPQGECPVRAIVTKPRLKPELVVLNNQKAR